MPKSSQPVFLARRSYRRRRKMDAARLLPIGGAVIFMLPVAWEPASTPVPDTARGLVYIFASWVRLILAALILARGLAPTYDEEETAEGSGVLRRRDAGGGAAPRATEPPPEE